LWIGSKWDIAETGDHRFAIYRKGNWRHVVGSLDLALAIVEDNEGFGTPHNTPYTDERPADAGCLARVDGRGA
jgi:hypothetical protein